MDDKGWKVDSFHGDAAGKVKVSGGEQKSGTAAQIPAWSPTRCVIEWEKRSEPWCRIGPEFKRQVISIAHGLPPYLR